MSTKICFVALSSYPMLSGEDRGHMLGPDAHTVLLARELLKRDYEITFITYDEGGAPVDDIDGIKVIKTYRYTDVHRKNTLSKAISIWKAMKQADAQLYFYHAGSAGVIAPFCRLFRRKSVWHLCRIPYLYGEKEGVSLLDKLRYHLELWGIDVFVSLNEDDGEALKRNFGKDSRLIRHHIIIPEPGMVEKAKPPVILWVGSMSRVKQPELFVQLAREMPNVSFRMIGGAGHEVGNYEKIKEACECLPNIQFMGTVFPFHAIDKYYAEASFLVNTAEYESYPPYAVLQAWANYAPVVTLNSNESADEIMYGHNSGFHSGSFPQLKEDVRRLLEDEPLRRQMGENGRRYVEEQHDLKKIARQHIEIFDQLLKS